MKVFDSDLLVAALRRDPDARRAVLAAGEDGTTTVLNAAELLEGAALAQRSDAERDAVESFLSQLKLLPFGPRAARVYGPVAADLWRRGAYPGLMDVLVGSIVMAEEAVLVTRNRKHFEKIPGLHIEPW